MHTITVILPYVTGGMIGFILANWLDDIARWRKSDKSDHFGRDN